jgi:signal peptidase I
MSLFIALEFTASLVIRTLVAQPYDIPSGAMVPTLEVGDYVVAAKFPYGYSNFSLPLGHLLPGFTYAKAPAKRGDIVIFRLPSDTSRLHQTHHRPAG